MSEANGAQNDNIRQFFISLLELKHLHSGAASGPVRAPVVVSFAGNGRPQAKSFPRKRESRPQAIGNAPATDWIPAFAGMTGASKAMRFQLTPLSGRTLSVGGCRSKVPSDWGQRGKR